MLRNLTNVFLILFIYIFLNTSAQVKPKITLDEFFDYTTYSSLDLSPNGQYLLYQTTYPSWNTSSYEKNLWIYDIQQQTKKLITNSHKSIKSKWSPSGKWIALLIDDTPSNTTKIRFDKDYIQREQFIYFYSPVTNNLSRIEIGKDIPLSFTWSENDFSLYLATNNLQFIINDQNLNEIEWKDIIQYRQDKKYQQSIIYRLNINENNALLSIDKNLVKNISFLINELLFVPLENKLIFTSMTISSIVENLQEFEIYSINLRNISLSIDRLTHNEITEQNLQLSKDGIHVLFYSVATGSGRKYANDTQARLYSLNIINGQMTHFASNFNGNINTYKIRSDGSVYIIGQLGTEIQIYSQRSTSEDLIQHIGWNGTYESITVSNQDSIAFVYSSRQQPTEIYFMENINQLQSAKAITNENKLFIQRDLPQTKVYQWKNEDDQRIIEGMLHYPPGKFESKNLPLLVLIHGGPYSASVNRLSPDWYTWAPLAATEGWLVLEPNYRGSTGYGDEFLQEIHSRPVSLPGKDILFGVDQLIRDGIVDLYRLSIGGYSYGGFLTNWLITQTKRFNAALSGAGVIDHVSAWGTMDIPIFFSYLFGGNPWEVPHIYRSETPIYQLDQVRTPTLINTGEKDMRVPTGQSYIMERGLHLLGVPVKLIIFPNEGHSLSINPWHGKIKVREELKWLKKYGNQSTFY